MQRPPDSHAVGAASQPADVEPTLPASPVVAPYAGVANAGGFDFDPHTGARLDRSFPSIDALAFRDPRDATRMARVRLLKGLDFVYSRFLSMGVAQSMGAEMEAQAVLVSSDQAPSLWKLLDKAARALDVRVPNLFVGHNEAGMQTAGSDQPFILVDAGLIDLLDDAELLFAFGRELGHILSGHVPYKMLARSIGVIGEAIGNFTLNVGAMVTTGLEAPLRDWDQFSEFSGDRAGLLAVQSLDVATSALFKLAAGGHRLFDEMSPDAFVEQGRRALRDDRPVGARLSSIIRSLQAGAPLLASRAVALAEWCESGEYAAVLLGNYARRP